MQLLKYNWIVLVMFLFLPAVGDAAEVRNLTMQQSGEQIVLRYDLVGRLGERQAAVVVALRIGAERYEAAKLTLKGDFGPQVAVGRGKRIVWEVLKDFPAGFEGEVAWDVTASGPPVATAPVAPAPAAAAPAARPTTGASFTDPATGMEFVFVPGGCYEMGDTFGDGDADEKPVHEVCVGDFHMGKYEVTVGQFRKFVNETDYRTDAEKGDGCYTFTGTEWKKVGDANWRNPGFSQGDDHPVVCVSWNDATAFAGWQTRRSGRSYRLPTEAEWEYAARSGGKRYKYSWGNGSPSGNIADESAKRKFPNWTIWEGYDDGYVFTAPVGRFAATEQGLHDMTGNVWEWCQDWYGEKYYANSSKNNPNGPDSGQYRVLRGGSWSTKPRHVRAAYRIRDDPDNRNSDYSFRLVLPAPR